MATYLIVHGGWGGGWEWRGVARRLVASGHEVHIPSLTGLGDRAHLATPAVGLNTHVQDIVAVVETFELEDVILVGQSYGGMVITGVADRMPERLRRLVYLDAFVPTHGVSCNDLCGPAFAARVRELAAERGDGWLVPFPFTGPTGLPPEVEAWYLPKMVAHPLATLDDPADLPNGAGASVPTTFVRHLDAPGVEQDDPLTSSARRARDSGWDYLEVVAPHDVHVSDPDRVASLLGDLANRDRVPSLPQG